MKSGLLNFMLHGYIKNVFFYRYKFIIVTGVDTANL
jgi:hypothetical protein